MYRYLSKSLAAAVPTPLLTWLGLALLVGTVLMVSGCGQKGALYIQPVVPAAAASAPAR